MRRLPRNTLEEIEHETKTSGSPECAEHSIQDVLCGTEFDKYMYYGDYDDPHSEIIDRGVSEAWGDFYCILNEIFSEDRNDQA